MRAKILTVFLPRFSRLFCLLSSRILQNNLLHLYLVKIRRHKLIFFANPQQNPCRISQFSKNRGAKLITHRGLGLAKSICAQFCALNLEAAGSNAKFCEFFSLEVRKLLCLQDRETIYESRCLRRARLNMICKLNHRKLYHVQMDVTKYLAFLDQFLTNDIIGSCALAKTINVMIDTEMSQKHKNWCDLLHY